MVCRKLVQLSVFCVVFPASVGGIYQARDPLTSLCILQACTYRSQATHSPLSLVQSPAFIPPTWLWSTNQQAGFLQCTTTNQVTCVYCTWHVTWLVFRTSGYKTNISQRRTDVVLFLVTAKFRLVWGLHRPVLWSSSQNSLEARVFYRFSFNIELKNNVSWNVSCYISWHYWIVLVLQCLTLLLVTGPKWTAATPSLISRHFPRSSQNTLHLSQFVPVIVGNDWSRDVKEWNNCGTADLNPSHPV